MLNKPHAQLVLFQFIKDVGIDWDASVYLEAKPGEYITIARKEKNGEHWFIGNSNGELERNSEIDLSFLDGSKTYLARIYRDAKYADYKTNPQSYTIESKEVTKQTTLQIKTVAAGGYAISIEPVN